MARRPNRIVLQHTTPLQIKIFSVTAANANVNDVNEEINDFLRDERTSFFRIEYAAGYIAIEYRTLEPQLAFSAP